MNAGNNQTLTVTFTPNDTNSFLTVSTNVAITVLPAPLIITANNTNKVYGAVLPLLTASYGGFVNGDTPASLTTPVSLGTAATAASAVGAYAITASGAADTNYSISYVSGTLTVNPASLIISANNTNKVYGASNPVFTASYGGFVNGDSAASLTTPVSLGTAATAASAVGTYAITASGAADTNYSISYVNGTLTVNRALLTIAANSTNKLYGAVLPVFTASYSGFVNGDTASVLSGSPAFSTTATATSNVAGGPYAIIVTNGTLSATNYSFNFVNGQLTILPANSALAVASSANPSPTGSNVTFTATLTAVAPGAGTPSGAVNFRIDGIVLAAGVLSGGVAGFTTNNLPHGFHTVVAEYPGDSNFYGSTNSLSPNQIINTPPVAGNVTLYRNPVLGVKVQLATLQTNASSPDGDALTLSASSTSASNATISVSGRWVFYTPPAGFTNADSFTYTVTDAYGGSATGIVTVAILGDNSPSQNLVITYAGNGPVLISGSGIPGYTYRLQYSVAAGPDFVWQDLATLTADSSGQFNFTDPPPANSLPRVYRSTSP